MENSKKFEVLKSVELIVSKCVWDGKATCPVADDIMEEVRDECAKLNIYYDKSDKVWRRKKTAQEHGWSELKFDMPLYCLDDGGKEHVYADKTHDMMSCTILGEPDSLVRQMYEWFGDHGFDIEDVEFELDGKCYECNSTLMHYHYGEGTMSFEEMMKEMRCIPLQDVLPELNNVCGKD